MEVGDDDPCEVPNCPVCDGPLTVAHNPAMLTICVCRLCGTSLSIPRDAWDRARASRKTRRPRQTRS